MVAAEFYHSLSTEVRRHSSESAETFSRNFLQAKSGVLQVRRRQDSVTLPNHHLHVIFHSPLSPSFQATQLVSRLQIVAIICSFSS